MQYHPVAASLQWTNRGTSEIGPNFITAQLTANSLLGGREQLGLLLASGAQYREYHGIGGFAATPLDNFGTSVSVAGFHSDASPSIVDLENELRYPHDLVNFRIVQTIGDRPNNALSVFTGLDYDDSLIRFDGQTLEADRVRVALFGAGLDGRFDGNAAYSMSSSVRYGVNGLGAGVNVVDGTTIPNGYTIGTLSSVISTRVDVSWSADIRLSGQLSGNLLPYEERFKIGTESLGRAFTTATLAGDSGIGVQGQVHYRLSGLPNWIGVPSLFAYTDYGTVWLHDLSLQQYAVTSGAGLALQVTRIAGSIEVGKPVGFSVGVPHDYSLIGSVSLFF